MPKPEEHKSQIDKFREAARELETDDDENRFDERLQKIAGVRAMVSNEKWFIQIWPKTGEKADQEIRFVNFESLRTGLLTAKDKYPEYVIAVHLPSEATDEDREEIIKLGGRLS